MSSGLEKIDRDLLFLIDCFREVLLDLGQHELAQSLPWDDIEYSNRDGSNQLPPRVGQAFAIAFQLLNMVEENTAAQTRRAREREQGINYERGLWGHVLQKLQDEGFKAEQIAANLPRVRVEPVLTAHPTEAKRLSVLEAHRALYLLLEKREDTTWTPAEQAQIRDDIKAALERLWRAGEVLLHKPEVADERRNVLYFLRDVFPNVLPLLDIRLRQAWQESSLEDRVLEEKLDDARALPQLSFGTWVGGDRDGHPFVTAQVTQDTLNELRLNALVLAHRQLTLLTTHMSLSSGVQTPPENLTAAIARLESELGARAPEKKRRSEDEPWRRFAALMRAKLPLNLSATRIEYSDQNSYRHAHELEADLQILFDSLCDVGAKRLAQTEVRPIARSLQTFGFYLASLDVRQNSAFHDRAIEQLLAAAEMPFDFAAWPETQRLEFLNRELQSPRPFLLHGEDMTEGNSTIGEEARAVLSSYRVLERHARTHGEGLGALIVSMTRSLSDLLSVYVLAREAGLATNTSEGLVCKLPVVPLFETLDDLNGSADLLREWLAHPMTQRSLRAQAESQTESREDRVLVQQVMVGYSDSNKDSGIFAAQWALQRAQDLMTQVARKFDVQLRFFHGRGGTVSRGAGPTHRFLEALPEGSLCGDLRLTEQGETFAQKYANRVTATYNLELLLAGVTETTLRHSCSSKTSQTETPLSFVADTLAAWSRDAYRDILQTDGFMDFYSAATPIDALEQARIGSRPARRTGRKSIEDLRAIPWVFAWNQARFYFPSWYGVGAALQKLRDEQPHDFAQLKSQIDDWPFLRYLLTNVETTLASTDETLMIEYSMLVEDATLRARFMDLILGEFARTRDCLEALFGQSFANRRPRLAKTLNLRSDALLKLHHQQIALLKQWRNLCERGETTDADAMLPQLLLSINAIASGLRTTG